MAQHRRRRHGGGRKRKDGPRTKSGRLSRAYLTVARDEGTPDLQRHKIAIANGSDPALSTCVSDVLLARAVITPEQHTAAVSYRRLRGALFGVPLKARDQARPEASEDRLAKLMRDFDRMARQLTVGQKLALTSVSLDIFPLWLKRQLLGVPLSEPDQLERRDLLDGLDAIASDGPAKAP